MTDGAVTGLIPTQWPRFAAADDRIVRQLTQLRVDVTGIDAERIDLVRRRLSRLDVLRLAVTSVAGLQAPVLADGGEGPGLRAALRVEGDVLHVAVPAALIDVCSVGLLWHRVRAGLLGLDDDEDDLDLLDVAQWQREETDRIAPGRFNDAFRSVLAARARTVSLLSERAAVDGTGADLVHECGPELSVALRQAGGTDDVLALALGAALPAPSDGSPRRVARVLSGRSIAPLEPVVGRLDVLAPCPLPDGSDMTVADAVAGTAAAVAAARNRYWQSPLDVVAEVVEAGSVRAGGGVLLAAVVSLPDLPPLPGDGVRLRQPELSGVDPGPADVLLLRRGDRVTLQLSVDSGAPDAARLEERLTVILRQLAQPGQRLCGLTRTGPTEHAALRAALTGVDGPSPASPVQHAVRASIERHPMRPALLGVAGPVTYAQLGERVAAAGEVLAGAGIGSGDTVGLAITGLVPFVVAALAVLECGATFIPVDPGAPESRRAMQLERCGAVAVMTGPESVSRYSAAPVHPSGSAYVLFTSGSTGIPNAVGVAADALAAYTRSIVDRLGLSPDTVAACPAAFTADLGMTTLWPVLAAGGSVVEIPPAVRLDAARFAELVTDKAVTLLKITPSHLAALLATAMAGACLPGSTLVLGGEPVRRSLVDIVRRLRPDLTVVNHYGPTETTVGACAGVVGDEPVPTVGTVLAHTRAEVVDANGQPVPFGHRGELVIGGRALALGYLGDPRLTALRFQPDPTGHGSRRYHTGDETSVDPDGRLIIHGRLDDQTKIRGFRVEPGEVAAVLAAHPSVAEASVLAVTVGPDAVTLIGFAVTTVPTPDGELLEFLAGQLPEHLVPERVHLLEALPRLANGKLDRAALTETALRHRGAAVRPRNDLEYVLADVWSQLIGVETVDVTANLFTVGANSLLVTQALSRVRELLDLDIEIGAFFTYPSIESLAAWLAAAAGSEGLASRVATVARVLRMTDEEVDEELNDHMITEGQSV